MLRVVSGTQAGLVLGMAGINSGIPVYGVGGPRTKGKTRRHGL